jgi:hypothetical protein
MFLANADKDWAMMSLDVSDAFLTVNQERPTVVTAVDAAGVQHRFILGKEEDSMEEDEEEVEENRKLKVKYLIENSRVPHSPAAVVVWFTERIERRVARGFYAPSYVEGRKQALFDLLRDCMMFTAPAEQRVYLDVIGNLGDVTDDEDSPVHALGPYGVETELRQAHQAIQIGTSLSASAASAPMMSAPSSGSMVTDAVADAMMDGSDNTISHYMRYLNDPGRMDGEN